MSKKNVVCEKRKSTHKLAWKEVAVFIKIAQNLIRHLKKTQRRPHSGSHLRNGPYWGMN